VEESFRLKISVVMPIDNLYYDSIETLITWYISGKIVECIQRQGWWYRGAILFLENAPIIFGKLTVGRYCVRSHFGVVRQARHDNNLHTI
jgi:hypothetical protein